MKSLFQHIASYATLTPKAIQALESSFTKKILAKNDFLLKEGKVSKHLYFIESGALRGYYWLDGKEITYWFGFENDFVTSLYSFTTGQAAIENIQLVEGSIVWCISKDKLNSLCTQYHEIESVLRIVYEQYYLRLEERFANAQFKTAKELYQQLLQQQPHIIERLPLGYVASYLGISQETLSRIRSQL